MEQGIRFGRYRFDLETGRLWSGKREIKLTLKASAVLKVLVTHAGRPVPKEELFASVWKGTIVSDDALISCVQELRRALADDAKQPRFIETRHRRGYQFVARLSDALAKDATDPQLPTPDMRPSFHHAKGGAPNTLDQAAGIRYTRYGGVNIAYQVVGTGPIDLVVAPGYMSHIEQDWRWPDNARFLRRLSSFARVILFDRRGSGLSDRLVTTSGFDEVTDDIAAVMDAAGSSRAVLLGGAEGGPMCILFAASFPKRTHSLILVASYARRMQAPGYPWGLDDARHRRILATYEDRWGREPVGIHLVAPTLVDAPGFSAWYTAAQRHGGSPGAAMAWYRITTEIDVRHVLPTVRVPTLVLHRKGDRVQPVESGRYLAEHIPGARYVELPGDDHFWFAGDADAILDEIEEFVTGTRHGLEPNRVLATVLFTDIVGSVERAQALGNRAWRDLLTRHHALVRAELGRWRGREVETAGDGFLATFDGPGRAIRCAAAIRKAVCPLGIQIRAGLHTGECELLGDRVTGTALQIGARVAALAGAGEVLVSSTVKDLVAGSGLSFEERGEHGLKGVPDRWRLYAVV